MADGSMPDGYIPWLNRTKYTKELAAGVGGILGFSVPLITNLVNRRPIYAGIYLYPLWTIGGIVGGYYLGKFRSYQLRLRDAIVEHYVSIHPDDFQGFKRSTRQYKDVLLPWEPVRAYERGFKYD